MQAIRSLQHFRTSLLAALLLAGCYTYQALPDPTPAPGTRVEAELTQNGSLQLANQIGPGASKLRGEVLESDPDTLLLAVTAVVSNDQQETFWNREQVRIPRLTVAQLHQRRFALQKSILFGGALAGGLLAAIKAFDGGGGGGGGGGTGGPQPQ